MKRLVTLLMIVLCTAVAFGEADYVVSYQVNGKAYEGYYIEAGKHAPLILLIHDWDGVTDYEIKRAHMLAELGYSVFVADLFGKGIRPTQVKDKKQQTSELYKNREKMRMLMHGALNEAKDKGADINNAVAVGYCFGGAAVLEMARSGADLNGFVTFHGGLGTPDGQDYTGVKGSILILHGSADSVVTMEEFAALAKELESGSIPHEMITYGGAEHAFSVFDGKRYHKEAEKKSWQRFLSYLKTIFNK